MYRVKYLILIIILGTCYLFGCENSDNKNDYGVFLSLDNSNMDIFTDYETVVIDAQYFTPEDIDYLHENNVNVLSYLNIGSIEDFRDYYQEYEEFTLGDYENWEQEKWVDVSKVEWQNFILKILAKQILDKGVDGFFVDNCDVYYVYNTDEIYNGISLILKELVKQNVDLVINGGDEFVGRHFEENGELKSIITGVNQEEVFSTYDFENHTSARSNTEDIDYFKNYIEMSSELGADVFIIEYTSDKEVIEEVKAYCNEKGFKFYISDSIELD